MNLYPVLILAGGLGTRLGKLSKNTPKSLMNINGKPFIDYQLKYLKAQNIENVVICVGHFSEQIEKYVGNGSRYGMDIIYSYDGINLLGTGGAIKNAIRYFEDDFFVMYGDSFLPIDFNKVFKKFKKKKSIAMMTILKNNNLWDFSNIKLKNDKIILYDKLNKEDSMDYIDYGLSVLKKNIFLKIDKKIFDLSEILKNLSISGFLDSYEVHSRFYEIGSIEGINDFTSYVRNK